MMRFDINSPEVKKVLDIVGKAGPEGITLKELEAKSGLRYRVVHNITWRLEGSPKEGKRAHLDEWKLIRVNTDSKVRYGLKPAGTPNVEMRGKYATGTPKPKEEQAA
jgi:hypothetical protein